MHIPRTLQKGLRDFAVMLAVFATGYLVEHVGDFGIPVVYLPIATAAAMVVYRYVRDRFVSPPA